MSITTKDTERLYKIAQEVIDSAQKSGVDRVKVVGSADETLRITSENREFTMANSLSAEGFGLLVHKDSRKGSATVNSTDMDDLSNAIKEAMGLAKYSVPDEYLTMPGTDQAKKSAPLGFLYDERINKVTPKEIEELMSYHLKETLADPRLAIERLEFAIGSSVHTLTTSEGVAQNEIQTSASWQVVGMARDGQQVSGMDYLGGHAFSWDNVAEQMAKDCEEFKTTVLNNLNPVKCPNYNGIVVLSPRAVRPLLISAILYHASGSSVMDGKSRWHDKVGKKVVSSKISINDNPHDKLLAGATAYDSDGLPSRCNNIVEKGILGPHLHSCYSAKRTNMQSNAMAGGPFGMTMASGEVAKADLLRLQDEILYVNRFSGNVDPLTGDFSGVAKSSHLYRKGENLGPVQETMIAGNIFEILEQVVGVSKESMNVSGSFVAPWVAVDGVSIS